MVRSASRADVSAMVAMAEKLHLAAGHQWAFQPERIGMFLRGLIADRAGLCLVLERDGAAVGMLAASFGEHPLGAGLFGMEWGFWIDPDARAGDGARELVSAYEADARRRGARLIALASLSAETARGRAVSRLFRRMGFAPREQHFDKAL